MVGRVYTFNLDEKSIAIVERVAAEYGHMSRSAALRYIIQDWWRRRRQMPEAMQEGGEGESAGLVVSEPSTSSPPSSI